MENTYEQKLEMKEFVMKRLACLGELEDEEILSVIEECVTSYCQQHFMPVLERQRVVSEIFNSIRKYDVLQELLENDTISEIMINGWKNIFIERDGRLEKWDKTFESKEKLEDVIQQMVSRCNRMVNESSPIVDARLYDGSRIHVVLSPISLDGPAVTIRKFPKESITMEQLIAWNAISLEAAIFLQKLVVSRYNIFVSGGTGSGKTTLLNVLSNYVPEDERMITIEDSAELQIQQIPNLIRLETKESIMEESKKITMKHLIKAALRMRPDRLVVGEVRDGEAVANMLQAMNTGAASMSTGHANSAKDMISRLEALSLIGMNMPLLSARKQIVSAIDIVIHLGRLRDKSRRVLEIVEIIGMEEGEIMMNPLFCYEESEESESCGEIERIEGRLVRTKHPLKRLEKLVRAGLME
ncbi:MAG: pilus assembly protein CpaF [Clostridiales bacterium]|nr:pilus assembly protein CpaF [Clostridiales bacterium]